MSLSHLKVTQAGLISLLTTIVGQVVAFVPAFAPDKQLLISAGSSAISAAFLLANAGHHIADSNVSPKDVEAGAIAAAKGELEKVDFNGLVKDAVSAQSVPDLEQKVQTAADNAVQRLLGRLAGSSVAGSSEEVGPGGQQTQPFPPLTSPSAAASPSGS